MHRLAKYAGMKRLIGSIAFALVGLVVAAAPASADICILGGEICIDTA